jgi:hypothetical protein
MFIKQQARTGNYCGESLHWRLQSQDHIFI